jgi:hypothetical protein
MLLLGVLLALLAVGLWMYALIDVVLTPAAECRGLPKQVWLGATGLLLPGALAWLLFGRPYAPAGWPRQATRSPWRTGGRRDRPLDARRRHPAGRGRAASPAGYSWVDEQDAALARAVGPDDDPEFLSYLDRVISDIREAGNGA